MSKEKIVKHHLEAIVTVFAECKTNEQIILRANEVTRALTIMVNPWGELIYPNLNVDKMTEIYIRLAQAVKSRNFQEIADNNLWFQNYDAICKSCPNYQGVFSKKCGVKRFESYGY